MIATCIYCGHQVQHGSRHSATQQEAHKALIEHDRQCPQNPIAQELAVERKRGDALAAHVERLREGHERAFSTLRWSWLRDLLEETPETSLARRLADERASTFARAASLCRHIENGQESLAWMHKETGPDGEDYVGERGIPYSNKALGANHCVDEMERQEKIARRQAKGGDA